MELFVVGLINLQEIRLNAKGIRLIRIPRAVKKAKMYEINYIVWTALFGRFLTSGRSIQLITYAVTQ